MDTVHIKVSSTEPVSAKFIRLYSCVLHDESHGRISGRGFLGLSQNGVSAHEFYSEPSAVSSSEDRGWNGVMTNLLMNMFIECVNFDTELLLDSDFRPTGTIDTKVPHPYSLSACIAIVSARSPAREVRSIRDRNVRYNVFLESIGEAVHHQIDCLRCCGSHDGNDHNCLDLLKGRQQGR